MPHPPRVPSKRTLAPQAPPTSLYLSTYDPQVAAAICRRVAAGESLRSICRADPSMPTGKTVWNWRRRRRRFRAMLNQAQGLARTRALAAQAQADAARRAARAGLRKAPGRTGRPSSFDAAAWDEIRARLMGGEGLTAICRDDHLPCAGTVYNWLRAAPERVAEYRKAKTYALDSVLARHCDQLAYVGARKSWPMLHRAIRAGTKEAARVKLKRYAPARR